MNMAGNQPTNYLASSSSGPENAFSIPGSFPYPHRLNQENTQSGEESSGGNQYASPVNKKLKAIVEDRGTERIIGDEGDKTPRIGMMFDSIEVAWEFWKKYGESVGFGVRKHFFNRSKKDKVVNYVVYVCCRQGRRQMDKRRPNSVQRWETRTQCQVKMISVLDRVNQKYKVKEFVAEHNHELEPLKTRHMLKPQRRGSEFYDLASEFVGNEKSYLLSRREKNMMYGELENIMKYFEEQKMKDHGFFYSMQFDKDELVANLFWADSKMIVDYIDFGDVMTFETTCGTNKELRRVGVFFGFNHHRQMMIFGGALMYDGSDVSFVWLFETFIKVHGGKRPQTIFTEHDDVMTKALQSVWPDTQHGLCTWHLNQSGLEHLGRRMEEGSALCVDYRKCMFDYGEESEFEKEWGNLLQKYDLRENEWMIMMYKLKEKWAKCYMKYAFTLGIRNVQFSESLNIGLKDYLKCGLNISHFFKKFDRVIQQKREKEVEVECRSRQRAVMLQFLDSPLLERASERYTPSIFEIFENELRLALRLIVQAMDETQTPHGYILCLHDSKDKIFKVLYDPKLELISCSCRMFDHMGVLCCHALKVFVRHDVMDIPEKYILPRWTRGYRSANLLMKPSQVVKENANQWVKRIQSQFLRMAHQACTHEVTRHRMEKMIMECSKEMFKFATKDAVD